jgi:hypothetical protein
VSRYIIDTNDYYRLVNAVTAEHCWEEWLLYALACIEVTSRHTLRKVAAIRDLQDDFSRRTRAVSKGGSNAELRLWKESFDMLQTCQKYSRNFT